MHEQDRHVLYGLVLGEGAQDLVIQICQYPDDSGCCIRSASWGEWDNSPCQVLAQGPSVSSNASSRIHLHLVLRAAHSWA